MRTLIEQDTLISNNWAQITYRVGTPNEERKLYDLDDFNECLLYRLEQVDNFFTSKRKEEFQNKFLETLKAAEAEAVRKHKDWGLSQEQWEMRYTI